MPQARADLAANLTAAEVRRVHVRIGQPLPHGLQSRIKVGRGNTLDRGSDDICCRDCPRDACLNCRWASRLAPAATEEYHDATSDLARREVEMATLSGDHKSEKVNEKLIVSFWIVISKSPVPAVLIGGTSSPPLSLAEKRSLCELT
jgi:hypothetical protein